MGWPQILSQSGSDEDGRDDWQTPEGMMRELRAEFTGDEEFDLDPACDGECNAKAVAWLTPEDDGTRTAWGTVDDPTAAVFCNPPYTRLGMIDWVYQATNEVELGHCNLVVLLLPNRAGTLWFDRLIRHRSCVEVRRIVGRIKYEHPINKLRWNSATFDSVIVVLRAYNQDVDYGTPRHTRWDIRKSQKRWVADAIEDFECHDALTVRKPDGKLALFTTLDGVMLVGVGETVKFGEFTYTGPNARAIYAALSHWQTAGGEWVDLHVNEEGDYALFIDEVEQTAWTK